MRRIRSYQLQSRGASQAMGDGIVMVACLDRAASAAKAKDGPNKPDVQKAVRVCERIRYERVHKIQQTGITTREQWHKADWDAIRKNPESMHLQGEAWILDFDAEEDAYASYDSVREKLSSDRGMAGVVAVSVEWFLTSFDLRLSA